jgi:predicted DCC family thiol-disulfide oxidoreductase YuxK
MTMILSTNSRPTWSLATLICFLVIAATCSSVSAFSSTSISTPKSINTKSSSLSASTAAISTTPISSIAPTIPTFSALFGLNLKRRKQQKENLFTIPSIFNPLDSRPIVLFDGKCNLCNAGVQLILDQDSSSTDQRGNLRVAALQSRVGKVLISRLSPKQQKSVLSLSTEEGTTYKSIVVASKHRTYLNSAACIEIGKSLKGPLRIFALLASLVPSIIRDPIYKLLSRYRKKLFGESEGCRLWDDNWDTRFVDDAKFGGRSGEIDPFADPNAPQVEDTEIDVDFTQADGPNVVVGDRVRVIGSQAVVHTHVTGYENGICTNGCVGTVVRVLERSAYPKSVVVKFDLKGDDIDDRIDESNPNMLVLRDGTSFEAHFYPGQLQKESRLDGSHTVSAEIRRADDV